MISKFTWKAYMLIFQIGHKLQCFPFTWNSSKEILEIPNGKLRSVRRWIWKINIFVHLGLQTFVLGLLFNAIVQSESMFEILGAFFLVASTFVAVSCQLQVVFHHDDYVIWANSLRNFNSKLGKHLYHFSIRFWINNQAQDVFLCFQRKFWRNRIVKMDWKW